MIGGTLIVRNAIELDYCFKEALASLQGVCDEIVVVDGVSDDGTWEWLLKESQADRRIRLINHEWYPTPLGTWLSTLANAARETLDSEYHVMLQADEVIHEDDYIHIQNAAKEGRSYYCRRLNFWKDAQHIAPEGTVCSPVVLRLAGSEWPVVGDAESIISNGNVGNSSVRIFHYGFLRKTDSLIRKGKEMENAFFGSYNKLYDQMEKEGRKPFDEWFADRLTPYLGPHPAAAHGWLKERGYSI